MYPLSELFALASIDTELSLFFSGESAVPFHSADKYRSCLYNPIIQSLGSFHIEPERRKSFCAALP